MTTHRNLVDIESSCQIKKYDALNLGKKESFKFVSKTANGEFRIAQIVRERVPYGGRGMEEAMRADCLSSRSRDEEKTLLEPG